MGSVNEGRCCDAVIRALEKRLGVTRSNLALPEKEKRDPPIEVECRLGNQVYAIEHTQIESFPNQIELGHEFVEFIPDIERELAGQLPSPGTYVLILPTSVRVRTKHVASVKTALVKWIRERAIAFHARASTRSSRNRSPRGEDLCVKEQPDGVPFEVYLKHEAHWSSGSQLKISRFAPKELDTLRYERMTMALNKKCPKLTKCKQAGPRTVLILEDGDISLSNHVIVTETLEAVSANRTDLPDEIWLIWPHDAEWMVIQIYNDGEFLYESEWDQYPAGTLIDLTESE